jgi:hypothetical protein
MIAGLYVKYTTIRNLWLFLGAISVAAAAMMYRLFLMDSKVAQVSTTESA